MELSVISSRNGRTFPKITSLNACKTLVIRCDGLLYDLLWRVLISVLKVHKMWLPWLLILMRINEMFNATEWEIDILH